MKKLLRNQLSDSCITMLDIVIAADKFKGTLTAVEACETIHCALEKRFPDAHFRICPMADGGEGTASLIAEILNYKKVKILCENSLFEDIDAEYFISSDGSKAIIDSSQVIGLLKLKSLPDPWHASSYPLGVVIRNILSEVRGVTVCIGGTSTVDCGLGMLQALGCVFMSKGKIISEPLTPDIIFSIDCIDCSSENIVGRIDCVSDVDVPLLSDNGKSMLMFAPQKGVKQCDMQRLRMMIEHIMNVPWTEKPDFNCRYAGAGGGLGFAVNGVLRGKSVSGAEYMCEAYSIFNPVPDVIITGEGRFDEQSLTGKVAGYILSVSRRVGIKSFVIAGCVSDEISDKDVLNSSVFFQDRPLNTDTAARRLAAVCEKLLV